MTDFDTGHWVKRHLQLDVAKDTVRYFDRCDLSEREQVMAYGDDHVRMVLMCLDAALQNGWRGEGCFRFERRTAQFCVMFDNEQVCVTLSGHGTCFKPNYYGQMQLHQWLLENMPL